MRILRASVCTAALVFLATCVPQPPPAPEIGTVLDAVVFYASFDEGIRGDTGGGAMTPRTRFNHETERGQYVHQDGVDEDVYRIASGQGVYGGALEAVDVLPRNGRIYFPAAGNLPYQPGGWSGSASVWLNTNPNTMLKTRFCDPVQITEKGAMNGGIWVDFPDTTPRDFRLGLFRSAGEGRERAPTEGPEAPLVVVQDIGFEASDWHHVAFTWSNVDSGQPDATATLYLDGRAVGSVPPQEVTMDWDLAQTGIYIAVNYIGLLDEFAIFNRVLTAGEVERLYGEPALLSAHKAAVGD